MTQLGEGHSESKRLEALYALSQAILGPHSVNEIVTIALEHLQDLVVCQRAAVATIDTLAGEAILHEVDARRAISEQKVPLSQFHHLEQLCASAGRPVEPIVRRSQECPRESRLRQDGMLGFLVLPLLVEEELLGLIRLARAAPEQFSPEEIEIVREVGNLVAVALLQARLQEQMQRYTLDLEQQVAERTALLRQQRDFLDTVFATTPALIIVHDNHGQILHYNQMAAMYTGCDRPEAAEQPIWTALRQTVELTNDTLACLALGEFPRHYRSHLHCRRGHEHIIDWSSSTLPGSEPGEEIIVSVGRDVTRRARAVQAYETLVEHSLQGLVILQENRIVFANPAFCELVGRTREEIYRMTVDEHRALVHPDDRVIWDRGQPPPPMVEFRLTRADGAVCWLRAETFEADYSERPALHAIVMDVTEAHQAELIRRESAALNQAVIDSLPLHVAVLDENGQIVMVNEAWKRFATENENHYRACTGIETHDLQVCRCAAGKDDPTAYYVVNGVRAVLEGRRQRFSHEYACHLAGGSRYFLMAVTPLNHTHKGAIVSHLDISSRHWAEEQMRLLNRRLRRLTQQVVRAQEEERHRLSRDLHDQVGQALTVLKYNLELLRGDLPVLPGLPFDLAACRQHTTHALRLCEETLAHIRAVAHDLRPAALDDLGLNSALEAYCHDFRERSGLQIEYQGAEIGVVPQGVDICLYRFLQEALTNVMRHAEASRVQVQLSRQNNSLQLSVGDNGQGMSHTEPSEERKEGIGLLGMQERLEAVGGCLQIWTRRGRGTSLTAEVPLTGESESKNVLEAEQR